MTKTKDNSSLDEKRNKLEQSWLLQAQKAVTKLMHCKTETCFDSHLFGDQAGNVICNVDVQFPDLNEKPLQILRAARLKFLGYTYQPATKTWIAASESVRS